MKKLTKEVIIEFKAYLKSEEKATATIEKYIRDLTSFADWLKGEELSKVKVLEYKEFLIRKYTPVSVNSMLSSLNSFFEYTSEFGLKVKILKIQRRIFARSEKELTKAGYERLLTAAKLKGNRKLFLLMQTICATGIRVSELSYITISSIQRGEATINMKGKMRIIMLPDNLCKMLKKYAVEQKITSGSVFISKNGKPLDRSNICAHVIIRPEFENPVIARV